MALYAQGGSDFTIVQNSTLTFVKKKYRVEKNLISAIFTGVYTQTKETSIWITILYI